MPNDEVTTASNISSNEMLFRLSIVGSLIVQLIHIAVVLVLYKLFKSVDLNHTMLLVVLGLVGVPIAMLNEVFKLAALLSLDTLPLMWLFLNLNEHGIFIAGIFWGLWLLPLGVLINKSGYFPRVLGVWMLLAGFGYVFDSFIRFIDPVFAEMVSPAVFLLLLGEIAFMAWLTLKGANIPKK